MHSVIFYPDILSPDEIFQLSIIHSIASQYVQCSREGKYTDFYLDWDWKTDLLVYKKCNIDAYTKY